MFPFHVEEARCVLAYKEDHQILVSDVLLLPCR